MSKYLKSDCVFNTHRKNKTKLICSATNNKNCKDCSFYQAPKKLYDAIVIPESFRERRKQNGSNNRQCEN